MWLDAQFSCVHQVNCVSQGNWGGQDMHPDLIIHNHFHLEEFNSAKSWQVVCGKLAYPTGSYIKITNTLVGKTASIIPKPNTVHHSDPVYSSYPPYDPQYLISPFRSSKLTNQPTTNSLITEHQVTTPLTTNSATGYDLCQSIHLPSYLPTLILFSCVNLGLLLSNKIQDAAWRIGKLSEALAVFGRS